MEGKQGKVRQKIEIKRIEKNADKLITFSKRKNGIYKKACEPSATCAAEVGMVIFSPTTKLYSFATSTIENIINRFFHRDPPQNENWPIIESLRQVRIDESNEKYNNLYDQEQEAKSKEKSLKQTNKQSEGEAWWNREIEELDLKDSYQRRTSLSALSKELSDHINESTQGISSCFLP